MLSRRAAGVAGVQSETLTKEPQQRRKGGVLGLLTKFMPTNYNMASPFTLLRSKLVTGERCFAVSHFSLTDHT